MHCLVKFMRYISLMRMIVKRKLSSRVIHKTLLDLHSPHTLPHLLRRPSASLVVTPYAYPAFQILQFSRPALHPLYPALIPDPPSKLLTLLPHILLLPQLSSLYIALSFLSHCPCQPVETVAWRKKMLRTVYAWLRSILSLQVLSRELWISCIWASSNIVWCGGCDADDSLFASEMS